MDKYSETNKETDALNGNQRRTVGTSPWLGTTLALLFAVLAFFSGFSMGTNETVRTSGVFSLFAADRPLPADTDLGEFWHVWNLMDEKFAAATSTDIPTATERIEGAINGMIGSFGDSYSVYMPPKEAESFGEDISGNFGGVGMEVGMRDDLITVIAPLPNTPAMKAGVQSGDIIVSIDDESTERMNLNEAVDKIRGERGTEVTLTLARQGELDFLEVTITRDTISIPTVETEIIEGVFVIRLFSFNATAEARMQEALREYVRSGSSQLVLDMRGNPGGFLQSAIAIGSYFLPAGTPIVTEHFGDGRNDRVFRSQGRTIQDFSPENMVVLVDRGSASASEIVAGALQEHGYATLIGTDTFGKGSVQELIDLPSGASLKVTVARWLTPQGNSISDGGVQPDIEIPRTAADREAERDPQLNAAIDYLLNRFDPANFADVE